MPAIFYREAFQAAAGRKPLDGIGDEHFTNWEKLPEALDRLSPEQQCDAVDADWLLQLHEPAYQALLQIRNLLIGNVLARDRFKAIGPLVAVGVACGIALARLKETLPLLEPFAAFKVIVPNLGLFNTSLLAVAVWFIRRSVKKT